MGDVRSGRASPSQSHARRTATTSRWRECCRAVFPWRSRLLSPSAFCQRQRTSSSVVDSNVPDERGSRRSGT